MKIVETVLGFSVDSVFSGQDFENEVADFEESNDISKFLHVEAYEETPSPGYESDDDFSPDKPLTCRICFATFKTRSGWKNHKVTHQKFRTKEFACYVCFRRFYWDKDCRRHIKNIHGEENYDAEESRRAADINYPKSKWNNPQQSQSRIYPQRGQINFPQNQPQNFPKIYPHNLPQTPNSQTSKFFHPNNNIFKMKIELLKNQEKKAINENAIKEPNSDEHSTPNDFSPTDTNENTNDGFFNEHENDDRDNFDHIMNSQSSSPQADFDKESTITMEEVKDHIKKVKDDLGDLLEEEDSSDGNAGGCGDDSFETIDPNLYTENQNSNQNVESEDNESDAADEFVENNDFAENHKFVQNNDLLENNKDGNKDYLVEPEVDEFDQCNDFAESNFAENNVDGMSGLFINDNSSSCFSSRPSDDMQVNEHLTVDMFDFSLPENICIEPKVSRDLFTLKKRFQCPECPRKFLNIKYLKIHENFCTAPVDSPYKCSVCDIKFLDFDCLQKHWKINHNGQQMI